MALSKRDTSIVYIMVGLLLAYVLWTFGFAPIYDRYIELNDELTAQQETFEGNQQILQEANEIEEGYKRVEASFPPDVPDRHPADVFSEEVTALVTQIVGKQPDVSPTSEEAIKGVEGYQMLTFPLAVKGELQNISNLLKAFDQKGFLVRNANITRESNLDKSELTLELTLARIVKIPDEEEEAAGPPRPGSIRLGRRS